MHCAVSLLHAEQNGDSAAAKWPDCNLPASYRSCGIPARISARLPKPIASSTPSLKGVAASCHPQASEHVLLPQAKVLGADREERTLCK